MPAGDRKIPEPIVIPTTSAIELVKPKALGSRGIGGVTPGAVTRALHGDESRREYRATRQAHVPTSPTRPTRLHLATQPTGRVSLLDRPSSRWYDHRPMGDAQVAASV